MNSETDVKIGGKVKPESGLAVGPVSGLVEIDDNIPMIRVQGPPPGPVVGPVDIVKDAGAEGDGEPPEPPPGPSPSSVVSSRGWDWLLLLFTAAGLLTLGMIVLSARIAAEFANLQTMSPMMAWGYIAAIVVAVVSLGLFAVRSWRRYKQIRDVTNLRQLIAAYQKTGGTRNKDDTTLRQELEEYLLELESHADVEARESISKVRLKFIDYFGDGKRDIEEFETHVLSPLDKKADAMIESRSAEVSVATALASSSFDAIIVTWQSVRLIGQISRLYAGRPGLWGTLRLFRRGMAMAVFADLADVATQALTEALAQKSLAAVGGRMAEGMANGLLMIRFGEAIKQQCRPAPGPRPSVNPLSRLVFAIGHQTRKSTPSG